MKYTIEDVKIIERTSKTTGKPFKVVDVKVNGKIVSAGYVNDMLKGLMVGDVVEATITKEGKYDKIEIHNVCNPTTDKPATSSQPKSEFMNELIIAVKESNRLLNEIVSKLSK